MGTQPALTNAQGIAYFAHVEQWLDRTGTLWVSLCKAAGFTPSIRSSVISQGRGMNVTTRDRLQAAMDANPTGISGSGLAKREFLLSDATQALADEIRAYLDRTGTEVASLALRGGRDPGSLQNLLDRPHRISPRVAERYRHVMASYPDGLGRRVVCSGDASTPLPHMQVDELEVRRRQVAEEREQRAMFHLSQEKPGLSGKRFSMRPVWEQVA